MVIKRISLQNTTKSKIKDLFDSLNQRGFITEVDQNLR